MWIISEAYENNSEVGICALSCQWLGSRPEPKNRYGLRYIFRTRCYIYEMTHNVEIICLK